MRETKLYQLFPAFGLPDASPFCIKLETFMRMVGHPYTNVYLGYPKNAPNGKVPYIDDGGVRIGDSEFILQYLCTQYGYAIDAHLTPIQKANGLAIRRLLEEHLYWAIVHSRWLDDKIWPQIRQQFFGHLIAPVQIIVAPWFRRYMRRQSHAHGMARHSDKEILRMGVADVDAVATLLGSNRYILGSKPSSFDATVYAFISSILLATLETTLRSETLRYTRLMTYCERMRSDYF